MSEVKGSKQYRDYKLSEDSASLLEKMQSLVRRPLPQLSLDEMDQLFTGFAQVAIKDGILALEELIPCIENAFFQRSIQLLTNGVDPELMREILEMWARSLLRKQEIEYRKVIEGAIALQKGTRPDLVQVKMQAIF